MACPNSLLLLLLSMVFFTAATAEELTLVPFSKTTLDYPIGSKEAELFATASATVQDLKANVGSDAVWLKETEDELGDWLENDVVLHDIPDLEKKFLNIVVSDALGDRPGDPTQVDVRSEDEMAGESNEENPPSSSGRKRLGLEPLTAILALSMLMLG